MSNPFDAATPHMIECYRRNMTLTLANSPGYPTTNPEYVGRIIHSKHGVVAAINSDYKSTHAIRRYLCGLEQPNYPMPAIPHEVEYFLFGVMVCEMNNPEYRLGLITLYPHN